MNRIDREKATIQQMIRLYCRRKEGNPTLCSECLELLVYAHKRLSSCKFGDAKPACQQCPVHCYAPLHRAKIREVMRYAGPRMPFFYPLAALRHLVSNWLVMRIRSSE